MTVRFTSVSLRVALAAMCVLTTGAASGPAVTLSTAKIQRLSANGLRADDPQIVTKLKALAVSRHAALFHPSGPLIVKQGKNKILSEISIPSDRPPLQINTAPAPKLRSLKIVAAFPTDTSRCPGKISLWAVTQRSYRSFPASQTVLPPDNYRLTTL